MKNVFPVHVYWLVLVLVIVPHSKEAIVSGTQTSAVPAMLQKPSSLFPMTFFAYTNWHLGDWPLLPPGFDNAEATSAVGDDRHDSDDHELEYEHAGRGTPADFEIGEASATTFSPYLDDGLIADKLRLHTRKLTKQQKRAAKRERRMDSKRGRGAEIAALVMLTKTSVDVLWQNGTRSCGVPASSLVPVDYLGDHEFWPEQFVLERSSECEGFDKGMRRVGNPPLHLS